MLQWLWCRRAWTAGRLIGIPAPLPSEGSEAPGSAKGCEPSWRVRAALARRAKVVPPFPEGKGAPPGAPLRLLSNPGHAFSLESCLSRVSQLLAGDLSYPRVELPGRPGASV